ncbi:Ankyrin repeat protein [Azoarcus sp. Aa7]|nr:Ankyrin repeat protein [Azoarcus sp. Aa7]
MSSIPSIEAILLQVHQSLGGSSYHTKPKDNFAAGQGRLSKHKKMGQEILEAIFAALDMDPTARLDSLGGLEEFGSAYKYLEVNTWTFAADQRQVLWDLLGYFYVPGIARRAAFWSLPEALDKGMPGGRFWYLPEIREVKGETSLYLPVAQVVDWLLDLLGMPLEEFVGKRSLSFGDTEEQASERLVRTLYNWRRDTTPNPGSFQEYFPDDMKVAFLGTFSLDSAHSPAEQFAAALVFVKDRKLSADQLRQEIPMTADGRLEATLAGAADTDEQAAFVTMLAERYAAPSPHTIRQRLLFARMVQGGYIRLLDVLCPRVGRLCANAKQNKVLQLFAMYKQVYNLTIDAWRHCRDQGETAENAWFEAHLPRWLAGLYLSILPSQRETGNAALAQLLTRRFCEMKPGAELEDHVEPDAESVALIIKRNAERMKAMREELRAESQLVERLRTASPWRALQNQSSYWVISQIAQREDISPRAKELSIQRLRELASTPAEVVQAIILELDRDLNGDRTQHPRDARSRVETLLNEAEASPGYDLWKAPILQYKAKHLLACNDFDGAASLYRDALAAGRERAYGPLRGEVGRDLLALMVANQKLIPGNHETYYREMLAGGIVEGSEIPSIEDTARWAAEYFWDTLYKPYANVERKKPLAADETAESIGMLIADDQEGIRNWIQRNRNKFNSPLHSVTGDSLLMHWIKGRTHFVRSMPMMRQMLPSDLRGEQQRFEVMLEHWREAVALLAQEAPKQLNIADFKGQTPLMQVTEDGDVKLVTTFLKAGADPNMQDYQGRTALHSAVKSRVPSCVDAILDHPCDTNKVTEDGQSALHTAVRFGNVHAVKRLLNAAPVLSWKRDHWGVTPLELAERFLEEPQSLEVLDDHLKQIGRRSASKRELEEIVSVLEQATPVSRV